MKNKKTNTPQSTPSSNPVSSKVGNKIQPYVEIEYTQRNAYIVLGIIVATCLFAYSPGLFNEFTWDARKYILDNPYFPKLLSESSAWFKDQKYGVFTAFELGNYHPITMFSWALEYMIVGKNTWLYHLDQALLHILNCWVLFKVIYRLHPKFLVAAITAILFAIHPLHVESVVWAAERKDTLYCLFLLLSFDYYIRWWQDGATNKKFFWLAVLMFFLSCFSKAMAVVLPVVFLLTDVWFFNRKIEFKLILEKWAYWIIAMGTGLLSIYVQKDAGADATTQINAQYTFFERTLIIVYNFSFYWFKMFLPVNLKAFYSYPNKPISTEFYVALITTPAIFLALYLLGKKNVKVWWAGAYFLIVILPVIQILPIGSAIVADRYFYVSSVGPIYLLGVLGNYLYEKKDSLRKSLPMIAGVLGLALTLMSFQRSKVWKDDLSVFSDVFEAYPTNGFIAGNIGWSYTQKKDTVNSIKYFEKAGELGWHTDEIHIALANIYFDKKDYKNALTNFEKAYELKGQKNILWNLGTCYYYMDQNDKAIDYCKKAIALSDSNFFAHNILGLTLTRLKQYDEAIAEFTKAQKLNPKFYDPYVNLSHVYNQMGRHDIEIPLLEKAMKLDPKAPLAYRNIGVAYKEMGNWQKAVDYWKRASSNVPKDGTFDYNIGLEYANHGNIPEGIVWMRRAVRKGDQNAVQILTSKGIPLQ
jgi:protein O-mannosyl-transferase